MKGTGNPVTNNDDNILYFCNILNFSVTHLVLLQACNDPWGSAIILNPDENSDNKMLGKLTKVIATMERYSEALESNF